MPAFTVPLHEFNTCHTPAGSAQGGQFCAKTETRAERAERIWKELQQAAEEQRRRGDQTLKLAAPGVPDATKKHGPVRLTDAQRATVDRVIADFADRLPGLQLATVERVDDPSSAELHTFYFKGGKLELLRDLAPGGESRHLMVMILGIPPAQQRKGYGETLLRFAHHYAKAVGYAGIYSYPDDRTAAGSKVWAKVPTTRTARHANRLEGYGEGAIDFWERAFTIPIYEANDCHTPAGSPEGGQFCSKTGGQPKDAYDLRREREQAFEAGVNIRQEQVSSNEIWEYLDTPKGQAGFSMKNRYGGKEPFFELHWLIAQKRGAGRAALEHVVAQADLHGVRLGLWAQPLPGQGENEGLKLTKPQLERFYRGFGFKTVRHEGRGTRKTAWMERAPKKVKA